MATLKQSKLINYLESNFNEFSSSSSERLKALYSDFSKSWILNKYAYDLNLNFWRRVILDSNQQGHLHTTDYSLVIDKQTVADKFLRPIIGKPLSLSTVIEHMENKHELISLKDFNKQYSPMTWYDWIVSSWKSDQQSTELTLLVVLPTLQSLVNAILKDHYEHQHDPIMTLTQFKSKYGRSFYDMELTDADIHLTLKYLHAQHGVALADHIQGYGTHYMLIKFPQTENAIATITDHDKAILSIRTTCHALSVQVDELQKRAEQLSKEAMDEKRNGHIPKALYCLKRKKSLEEVLEKRLKSMETMDTILLKIESSQDNIQVIQAFNMGADTLKHMIHYEGFDINSVDDVMEKVQLALQDQKEIEDALTMPVVEDVTIDEQELEQELSQLLNEKQPTKEPIEKHEPSKLPSNSEPPSTREPVKQDTVPNSELARLNQMFSMKELAS